jgi:hypothetical protein
MRPPAGVTDQSVSACRLQRSKFGGSRGELDEGPDLESGELREQLRTLDALIDHLRHLEGDDARARLARAQEDRRRVLQQIAERIRRDEWPSPSTPE